MKQIQADMAGVVVRIAVAAGDAFAAGQEVAVLESMKMQIPVSAGEAGTVARVVAQEGAFVNEGDVLLEYE